MRAERQDTFATGDLLAIADAMPGMVFRDSAGGDRDYCNRYWYDFTGLTEAETLGKGWLRAIHPDDIERVGRWWRDPVTAGRDVEHRIRAADGSYRWFLGRAQPVRDDSGTILRWIGVAIDIDDSRRAEADRQAAAEQARQAADRASRLQRITAALVEAMSVEDVARIVLDASIAATGAFAGTVTRVVDGTHIELIDLTGFPDTIRRNWRRPIDGEGPHSLAVRGRAPVWLPTREAIVERFPALGRGELGVQAMAIVPLVRAGVVAGTFGLSFREPRPASDGEIAFLLGVAEQCAQALDRIRLTEQAQATERERAARLEAEQQVRQREQFLSIASHELRTPVTAVTGYVQLLERVIRREPIDRARAERHLIAIQTGASRLTALTNDLLDVSRLRFGRLDLRRRPFDLTGLVGRIVRETRDRLDSRYRLSFACDAAVTIDGDQGRIDQVIQNLLSNAVKYSPDGGDIGVQLERDGDAVRVTIDDTGIGVPFDSLETIFVPFGRAENANAGHYPGWGLGLYICREIVELHGGRIWAEPNPAGGLRVTLRLPRQ